MILAETITQSAGGMYKVLTQKKYHQQHKQKAL